jgi:hypothetical protein
MPIDPASLIPAQFALLHARRFPVLFSYAHALFQRLAGSEMGLGAVLWAMHRQGLETIGVQGRSLVALFLTVWVVALVVGEPKEYLTWVRLVATVSLVALVIPLPRKNSSLSSSENTKKGGGSTRKE